MHEWNEVQYFWNIHANGKIYMWKNWIKVKRCEEIYMKKRREKVGVGR